MANDTSPQIGDKCWKHQKLFICLFVYKILDKKYFLVVKQKNEMSEMWQVHERGV